MPERRRLDGGWVRTAPNHGVPILDTIWSTNAAGG
jgi:hypothetical protein